MMLEKLTKENINAQKVYDRRGFKIIEEKRIPNKSYKFLIRELKL